MANTVSAIDYLMAPRNYPPAAVCVVFGDEDFLKRRTLLALRKAVLGEGDADFSLSTFEGPSAQWRDVEEDLSTRAMFGSKRLVLIEEADEFVTRYRAQLEAYVARPRSTNVLVLDVQSWAANTRLYKAVDAKGLQIRCAAPDTKSLPSWLVGWAKHAHGIDLAQPAAEALAEMIGAELGLLDQELAKLAVSAGPGGKVNADMVGQLAAWRARTTWVMIEAALDGNLPKALVELDRLLLAGESPVGILAQAAAPLRRLAAATRLVVDAESAGRRMSLRSALEQVGVHPYYLPATERQLRRLGRERGQRLYQWLLEADLDLKGASRLAPQTVLERLLVRVASPQHLASGTTQR
ncbi:MAG: DNA polymerase III subunit delta [Thermoguttaceae bacterium]|jgi:DNA polymerase-3 subunit delta|nr:DNA polymerase III subunit delta [Thermoguttaceae bacterium]